MRITKKDYRILTELSQNSRISFSSISRKAKTSQQVVSYRVKKFLEEGIINQFYPIIDYSRFGYHTFRVYFSIQYINKQTFAELIEFFVSHNNTLYVAECGGRWDLMAVFAAKNASKFNKELKEIMYKFPKQLKNYDVLTTVVIHELGKKYLIPWSPNIKYKDHIVGGDREPLTIDETSMNIIKELMENARKSLMEISQKINLTPKTIVLRLKSLEKQGIIRGYSTLMDKNKLGYSSNKLLIKYHNLSVEKEESLIRHLINNTQVTRITKVLGEWDLEVDADTKTSEDFRRLCRDIKEFYEDIIHDFDSCPLFETYKNTYLPEV